MKTFASILIGAVAFGVAAVAAESGITVRTDVPFGNAGFVRVEKESAGTTVRFIPDTHGGPECLWFCFRVQSSAGALGKLRLVLECPETMLGGNAATFRPVWRAGAGDWERTGPPNLIPLPDGRQQAEWSLASDQSQLDFAFAYPYGRDNLDQLIQETSGYWHRDVIGLSQGGRPLVRLSNDYGKTAGTRPGFYLMCRQHSGEVSGSWVLDGVLRRFAELGDAAPLVWVMPLGNIDGVEQGDYGKDNFPYDLNRAWGKPPMRHETQIFQQDLRRWAKRCRPVAGIDFHSPGAGETEGIYAFVHVAEAQTNVAQRQAIMLATTVEQFLKEKYAAAKFIRSGDYASRWNTPRFGNFCQDELHIPGLSFETPYGMIHKTVMTREEYREAGRRVADAMMAYLKTSAGAAGR